MAEELEGTQESVVTEPTDQDVLHIKAEILHMIGLLANLDHMVDLANADNVLGTLGRIEETYEEFSSKIRVHFQLGMDTEDTDLTPAEREAIVKTNDGLRLDG